MNFSNKYLSMFNDPPGAGLQPAPVAVVPPPAAPAAPPPAAAPVVVDMVAVQRNAEAARASIRQAQQAAPAGEEEGASASDIRALQRQVRENAKTQQTLMMELYRTQAINNALAGGRRLIDSLVGGNSPAEIDASIRLAEAEYQLIEQRITEQVRAQAALQAQQAAAAAPVIVQPPPQPQQVEAPQYQQQQMQQPVFGQQPVQQGFSTNVAPPSLPGFVAAQPVPQSPPGLLAISQDQLAALTSGESIRNGTYAANRAQLHAALRAGGQGPQGQPWSFNQTNPRYQVQAPAAPVQYPPASLPYGAQAPQVAPAGPVPLNAFPPNVAHYQQQAIAAQFQQPVQQQFQAPQPTQLEQGAQLNPGAAAQAAAAAIAARRVR